VDGQEPMSYGDLDGRARDRIQDTGLRCDMNITFDLSKTLEQLEGEDWGDPEFDSYLVKTCHRLRKIALRDFANQDLRIMIGQSIGLRFLVPLAVDRLRKDVFLISEFYEGDLLINVLSVDSDFWKENPQLQRAVAALATEAKKRLNELTGDNRRSMRDVLRRFNGRE